jgi:hypothetical protein
MFSLLNQALLLDLDSKKVFCLAMTESIAKDEALSARVETDSNDNLSTFQAMGEMGFALKAPPVRPREMLLEFIQENPGFEYLREHVILTIQQRMVDCGVEIDKHLLSKSLGKIAPKMGVGTRQAGRQWYWVMPEANPASNTIHG